MDFFQHVPNVKQDIGRSSVIVLTGNNDGVTDELTVEDMLKEMLDEDDKINKSELVQ